VLTLYNSQSVQAVDLTMQLMTGSKGWAPEVKKRKKRGLEDLAAQMEISFGLEDSEKNAELGINLIMAAYAFMNGVEGCDAVWFQGFLIGLLRQLDPSCPATPFFSPKKILSKLGN